MNRKGADTDNIISFFDFRCEIIPSRIFQNNGWDIDVLGKNMIGKMVRMGYQTKNPVGPGKTGPGCICQ
jgi:hypothetical protein